MKRSLISGGLNLTCKVRKILLEISHKLFHHGSILYNRDKRYLMHYLSGKIEKCKKKIKKKFSKSIIFIVLYKINEI